MILADSLTTATLVVAGVTLLLAFVTAVSVWIGIKGFRQTGKEIEEAHRPLLVPLDGRATDCNGPYPSVGNGHVIPVENIGTGPALHVVAQISGSHVGGQKSSKPWGGLAISARADIEIAATPREATEYVLLLMYQDVAGKRLTTTARYNASLFDEITLGARPLDGTQRRGP